MAENKHASLTKKYIKHKINTHTRLKPGSVASYDIRPGDGVELFWLNGKGWNSKKTDEASKKKKHIKR